MSLWLVFRPEDPDGTTYEVIALNPEAAVRTARLERFGFVLRALNWACMGDDWRAR